MDPVVLVLVWTACAVGAWWIATTKKAPDPGTWAAMGLLFGPLGVLGAIGFARPRKET